MSLGTIDSAPVDPRLLLGSALVSGVPALILAHNHPSGDPLPSAQDEHLTHGVAKAAAMVGLKLLDHVIVGRHGFFSFQESGRL